jgi:hypothetical protein
MIRALSGEGRRVVERFGLQALVLAPLLGAPPAQPPGHLVNASFSETRDA